MGYFIDNENTNINEQIDQSYKEYSLAMENYKAAYYVYSEKKEIRENLIKIRTNVSQLIIELSHCYENLKLGLTIEESGSGVFNTPDKGSIMLRVEKLKKLRIVYFDPIIKDLTLDILKLEEEIKNLKTISDNCWNTYWKLLNLR